MIARRLAQLLALAGLAAIGSFGTASAASPPTFNLDIHHNETSFPPGGIGEYWFDLANIGDTAASGPIKVTVDLPEGITLNRADNRFTTPAYGELGWECVEVSAGSVVECTTTFGSIPRHAVNRTLVIDVNVAPAMSGEVLLSATVEGGGAVDPATDVELTSISPEPAGFGIVAPSFRPDFFRIDGLTPVREAGAHPELMTVPFDFNTISVPGMIDQKIANQRIRDLRVELPPGFVGNPTAVGECTPTRLSLGACPPSSQVGKIDLRLYPISTTPHDQTYQPYTTGVFNMEHPRGTVADLAFSILEVPVHIRVKLNPADNYAIMSEVPTINETLAVFEQKLTLWGVPADHTHDSERCQGFNLQSFFGGDTSGECATDFARKPFLSVPSDCGNSHTVRLRDYDSWQSIGTFGPPVDYTQPGETTACDKPRFDPQVEVEPTGKQANTPTGLDVHIKVPQTDSANALATPPVKRIAVTLPEGMSFSPSFTDGLSSCTLAQMQLENNNPIECPDNSRIGEVTLHTPLLPKSLEGSMYLAAQGDNPFGSTFALILALHDVEERGVLLKIPGRIEVDESTGEIETVFDEAPQFPFDDLTLKFRSGPRAPLVSPPSCGKQTIAVKVASYAQPNDPVDASNTYEVSEGPNGTPCPPSAARLGFRPNSTGGTLNPVAGAYSPFFFRFSRDDSEQALGRIITTLPKGLLAKIAGVPLCSSQAIESISTALGTGKGEAANPACPAASRIGTVSAGLGAGPGPRYFDGAVYLAGPYKGAPLSLAIVAPALAGPYDLGNVVVRVAINVDPVSGQITAVSDAFPRILHGVILRVRDVRLRIDRPETTLNPTSCEPASLQADLFSTSNALWTSSTRFQVGECDALGFKPKLAMRLSGSTQRGKNPSLRAVLTQPKGQANISRVAVVLPRSQFIDNRHINNPCTRVQFNAGAGNGEQCPPKSRLGWARAFTPLLDKPLEGPVYFRSNGGERTLPDLVAALQGQFDVNVIGYIDSVGSKNSEVSRLRSTFATVPDAPVTKFVLDLKGGKVGLLQNAANLCKVDNRALIKMVGQNGRRLSVVRPVANGCGGKGR